MKLFINLKSDVIHWDKDKREGYLKEGLFGFQDFMILENSCGYQIVLTNDEGQAWTFDCTFSDHNMGLNVDINP